MTELIKEQDVKNALATLLVKCASEYVIEVSEDIVVLHGYFSKELLLNILLLKRHQMQKNPINEEYHLYQPGFVDISKDSDDVYLDGQFRVADIENYIEHKWGDLITKEQYDAADSHLDEHNESSWVDLESSPDEVKLDGWFTIADLEAVITMKKYLLQNPEAKTDA